MSLRNGAGKIQEFLDHFQALVFQTDYRENTELSDPSHCRIDRAAPVPHIVGYSHIGWPCYRLTALYLEIQLNRLPALISILSWCCNQFSSSSRIKPILNFVDNKKPRNLSLQCHRSRYLQNAHILTSNFYSTINTNSFYRVVCVNVSTTHRSKEYRYVVRQSTLPRRYRVAGFTPV